MRCPVDQDVELAMTSREGVEIDYCPKCRGVWLDRGELDKLIERSLDDLRDDREDRDRDRDADRGRDRDDRRRDDDRWRQPPPYGYKHKKRESFFERIFDFD
jgi:uncharacterized protein